MCCLLSWVAACGCAAAQEGSCQGACSCCSCACPCRSYCCLRCAVAQQFCRGVPVCSWQALLHRSRSALLYYHICASPQRVTLASTSTSTSVCLLCCWRLSNVCHSTMPGLCNSAAAGMHAQPAVSCGCTWWYAARNGAVGTKRIPPAWFAEVHVACVSSMQTWRFSHPDSVVRVVCDSRSSLTRMSCVRFPRPFWTAEACLLGTCNPSLQRRAGVMCLQWTCQHQQRLCCCC